MLSWARNLFSIRRTTGRAPVTRDALHAARALVARYDSAQTTEENKRLWVNTDLLSAKAANAFNVRQVLRRRSRYEVANNAYANGIAHALKNDVIGTGPKLQILTDDEELNTKVETAFANWCKAINLTEKLQTIKLAKTVDGEGFFVLKTYDAVDDPVKLYPQPIEADQITNPEPKFAADYWVDGVVMDDMGEAVAYDVLRDHPGDLFMTTTNPLKFDRIAKRFVIHWFRKDRPGQLRGIPELTPALELFGEIRAYRKSVLTAARTAASQAAVLETEEPPDGSTDEPEPFDVIRLDNGMMVTLPYRAKMNSFPPIAALTTYEAFVEKLLSEACRAVRIPLNAALGTSQEFNFSSARLDILDYRDDIGIERDHCEAVVVDPLFCAWLDEAVMVEGLLPKGVTAETLPREWHWPAFERLDPLADAETDDLRLATGTDTPQDYWGRQGQDWKVKEEQKQAAEAFRREMRTKYGNPDPMPIPPTVPGKRPKLPKPEEAAA